MTVLRVIVDEMISTKPGGVSRYAEELTRELIRVAPSGCSVDGVVSASTEAEYASIRERLPGLGELFKSALARRELTAAWQHGFTRLPGSGMVHSPSLLAPLVRHDRLNGNDQIAVTIHDALPWLAPEAFTSRSLSWHKAMAKRAEKYADAVVVPTHAVAEQLAQFLDLGDRIRVIGGAASPKVALPVDASERAVQLELPDHYVVAVGGLEPYRGIDRLIVAMALSTAPAIPLLIVGLDADDPKLAEALVAAGIDSSRVRGLGSLSDQDLAVVLQRAALFVFPSLEEGFGLPLVEAFQFGTPVVLSDAPALVEIAADAGLIVERGDLESYPERLATAMSSVVADQRLAERLHFSGLDRSQAFSWRNSAEKVWQLHADL